MSGSARHAEEVKKYYGGGDGRRVDAPPIFWSTFPRCTLGRSALGIMILLRVRVVKSTCTIDVKSFGKLE
jgi:hypothetical protein